MFKFLVINPVKFNDFKDEHSSKVLFIFIKLSNFPLKNSEVFNNLQFSNILSVVSKFLKLVSEKLTEVSE